jgi:hypothetical protein
MRANRSAGRPGAHLEPEYSNYLISGNTQQAVNVRSLQS